MAIRIVCSWCSSDDVSRDAWANWDVKRQEWVLRQAFDDGFCHACEQARELEKIDQVPVNTDIASG